MTAQSIGWAMAQDTGDATDKLILIHIADNASDLDEGGQQSDLHIASVYVDRIAVFAMCSPQRVLNGLVHLETLGLIQPYPYYETVILVMNGGRR